MTTRAQVLADRIRQGADALANYANTLSEQQWQTAIPGDGRLVGVVVHHVASSYPVEVQLAKMLASGSAITDVTPSVVDDMNAQHATTHQNVSKTDAILLLRKNAASAAHEISQLTDTELDMAAPVSLNADAPLTAQFFIEDHALRHSFHHLLKIRNATTS